jgi:membrane-associated phospholipid phosphatase
MAFHTSLHGPWLLDWTLKPLNLGSNCVDAFPSVHMAASLYLLIFDWRHRRRRFWWFLAPCLVLWFSITYLRFHYFVDEFVGIVLALACWWLATAYAAATSGHPMSREIPTAIAPDRPTGVPE